MTSGPLRDLVVLDFGQLLAGPFATTLLADFGATTIKIERPGKGDALRDFGPSGVEGPIWWRSINRNKKSLALDWKRPESRQILERLIRRADVMVENFRAGVLESNGLGPDILHQWNPRLILLRVSGYGQSGPYRKRPGFGKAAEAFSGFCHLTGFPDRAPVFPGFPMADMTTGLMGAYSIMMAVHARDQGLANGQVIDLPIYETMLRLIDYHIPVRTGTDLVPNRNGNSQPPSAGLSGVEKSRDGRWIGYAASSYAVAKRLLSLVGGSDWADQARFGSLVDICSHAREIEEAVSKWMAERTAEEVVSAFETAEAVAIRVYDTDDILSDPHIAARNNVIGVEGMTTKFVNVVPRMSETPGKFQWPGDLDVGAGGAQVMRDLLGFDDAEIKAFEKCGAIELP